MTEQEKKALEDIKNIVTDLEDAESGAIISLQQNEIDSLKIIAELIEKQRNEIEELYKINKMIELYKCEGLPEDTEMVVMHKKDFLRNFEVISKDTIREKIKEYDKWIEKGEYTESLEAQRYALNELLEE